MRAHGGAIVDEARREMRQLVAIDWTHATTTLAERPYVVGHRDTRPDTVGEFRHRWGKLCTVHKKTTHQIRFVRLLMPEAMSVDADGGLDSDDDDGDE